jgi:hypothetical protein
MTMSWQEARYEDSNGLASNNRDLVLSSLALSQAFWRQMVALKKATDSSRAKNKTVIESTQARMFIGWPSL